MMNGSRIGVLVVVLAALAVGGAAPARASWHWCAAIDVEFRLYVSDIFEGPWEEYERYALEFQRHLEARYDYESVVSEEEGIDGPVCEIADSRREAQANRDNSIAGMHPDVQIVRTGWRPGRDGAEATPPEGSSEYPSVPPPSHACAVKGWDVGVRATRVGGLMRDSTLEETLGPSVLDPSHRAGSVVYPRAGPWHRAPVRWRQWGVLVSPESWPGRDRESDASGIVGCERIQDLVEKNRRRIQS